MATAVFPICSNVCACDVSMYRYICIFQEVKTESGGPELFHAIMTVSQGLFGLSSSCLRPQRGTRSVSCLLVSYFIGQREWKLNLKDMWKTGKCQEYFWWFLLLPPPRHLHLPSHYAKPSLAVGRCQSEACMQNALSTLFPVTDSESCSRHTT